MKRCTDEPPFPPTKTRTDDLLSNVATREPLHYPITQNTEAKRRIKYAAPTLESGWFVDRAGLMMRREVKKRLNSG